MMNYTGLAECLRYRKSCCGWNTIRPLAAVVGGVSGIGTKTKKVPYFYTTDLPQYSLGLTPNCFLKLREK